jgi:hypothetical protein
MKKYILFRCGFAIFIAAFSVKSFAQNIEGHEVKIADFKVQEGNNKIFVNWTAGPETSTNYFEVEKSADGKIFRTVAYVLGADPSKNNCNCYSYFEKISTEKGESFYRVKHIDKDGEVKFSETKMPELEK